MGTCRPTPTQLAAVCADWHQRTSRIAAVVVAAGDQDTLRQLAQIGLDLASAAWAMEMAALTGAAREHDHDPVALSILLGQVDRRLIETERALAPRRSATPPAVPEQTQHPAQLPR